MEETAGDEGDLTWDIDVPLLRNASVVGDLARVFGIAALLMAGLLSLLLAANGDPESIPMVILLSGAIAGVLFLIGLASVAVIYRGRMRFRYTLTSDLARAELIDTTVKAVNRATIIAGILAGRPGAVGTGLIAASQESTEVEWDGAFRATYDARRRRITLRNSWRRLFVVYATPETWDAVAGRVGAEIAAHGTEARAARRTSPLPQVLGLSALAVVASLVVFPLSDQFGVSLLVLTIMLCFALATVWLVGLFGWVVVACVVLVAGQVAASMFEVRDSFLEPGTTYRHLDVLSGDDVVMVAIAGVGLVVLVALSVAAMRGRLPSMLERDAEDAGA